MTAAPLRPRAPRRPSGPMRVAALAWALWAGAPAVSAQGPAGGTGATADAARPATPAAADSGAPWSVHAEIAVVGGGTWLDGATVPTVRSGGGALFGMQFVREHGAVDAAPSAPRMAMGVAARVSATALSLHELGTRWDGGTLTECDLLGVLTWRGRGAGRYRIGADMGVGAAFLAASSDIAPFRGGTPFAPVGELAVVVGRATDTMAGRPYTLVARVSGLRFSPADAGDRTDVGAGFVTRFAVGLRVGR